MSARHVKIRDGLELTTAKKVDEKKLHGLVEDLAGALSKTTPAVSQVASPMDALYHAACHEKKIEPSSGSWQKLPEGILRRDLAQEAYWMVLGPHYAFMTRTWTPENTIAIKEFTELMKYTAGVLFKDTMAYVIPLPKEVHYNANGTLHSRDGMAIQWEDGFGVYAWNGMHIPYELAQKMIVNPGKLTTKDIDNEPNAELRRALMEAYSLPKYLKDTKAKLIDNDPEWGKLYEKQVPEDESIVMIELTNPTPDGHWEETGKTVFMKFREMINLPEGSDPDGIISDDVLDRMTSVKERAFIADEPLSYSVYFHRVPPATRTAKEAVAWMQSMDQNDMDYDFRT